MALTNAERQNRYRQRLKARASGQSVPDQVRQATERAVLALWAFHERPAPGGLRWADIDGCRTPDEYRTDLARVPGSLVDTCRAFLPACDGLLPDEAQAIRAVVEIADMLEVQPAPPPRFAAV